MSESILSRIGRFFASTKGIIAVGLAIGVVAVLLTKLGNPANMGICVACFIRDTAGALGLHRAAPVQYIRPEITGFVLGSLASALLFREFRARGGSTPLVRFVLGFFAMVGALIFLGCPWRALLRLAGGDLNAITGIAGLIVGVSAGAFFLRRGFSLGRSQKSGTFSGLLAPIVMAGLLVLVALHFTFKSGEAIFFSAKGPGSMHAPILISAGIGILVGILAQRTRFCTMGAVRDAVLIRDFHLLWGIVALVIGALAMNLIFGTFRFGIEGMPIAHSSHVWNFLGMSLAGLAFALGGGCPGRQLILSGEGDGDAAIFVAGMFAGAAFAHNWLLAAVPDAMVDGAVHVGGPGLYGKVAVLAGLVFCGILGFFSRLRTTN